MYAPKLHETERSRDMIQEFRGYNHNLRIGDNEFYDMKNMTGSYYPVLSPRGKRGKDFISLNGTALGLWGGNDINYVLQNETTIQYKDKDGVLSEINNELSDERKAISAGGRTMILPDWIKYDYVNGKLIKPIRATECTVFGCTLEGEFSNSFEIVDTLPSASSEISGKKYLLLMGEGMRPNFYHCKSGDDDGGDFKFEVISSYICLKVDIQIEEAINCKFIELPRGNEASFLKSDTKRISVEQVIVKDGYTLFILDAWFCSQDDYRKDKSYYQHISFIKQSTGVPICIGEVSFPNFSFITESENRLWGARYGESTDGFLNEISASEQGFFWGFDYGTSTADSPYTVSIGSDGPFTGAITYQGHPIFFKENCYHIVYGSYPSNYQVVTENGYGVQAGSDKSLCIIDGVLYYKAPDGVYRFDGASHEKISEALGFERYKDAVGGTVDGKYYICMTDENGTRSIFVYDTRRGLWHKEDDANVLYFASYDGDLYFVEQTTSGQRIGTVKGTAGVEEDDVEWFVETGIIGYSTPDSKYVGKLQVRLKLDFGSRINFYIEYDSDGYMEFVGGLEGTSLNSFTLPILPRRCDHFKIRIEGVGECKIFSLCKVLWEGGGA